MGRRNRRDGRDVGAPLDLERARRGFPRVISTPDGQWTVRPISPEAAAKTYRCPGCDHEIRPGTAHVVAWPSDERGGPTERRHWHTACWSRHRP